MTPFMLRIQSLVDEGPDTQCEPELRVSVPRTIGHGAHEQVELRSLAEQLVCEANTVLTDTTGSTILLEDHGGTGQLAFSVYYDERWARVVTRFDGHDAVSQLLGPDIVEPTRELTGAAALEDLIYTLVATQQSMRGWKP